jgi:hypothetical protein
MKMFTRRSSLLYPESSLLREASYIERSVQMVADLTRFDFSKRKLHGIRISHALLSEAKFGESDLTGAHLRGLTLIGADFTKATISRTDFSDSNLSGVTLKKVMFTELPIFINANMTGVIIGERTLERLRPALSALQLSQIGPRRVHRGQLELEEMRRLEAVKLASLSAKESALAMKELELRRKEEMERVTMDRLSAKEMEVLALADRARAAELALSGREAGLTARELRDREKEIELRALEDRERAAAMSLRGREASLTARELRDREAEVKLQASASRVEQERSRTRAEKEAFAREAEEAKRELAEDRLQEEERERQLRRKEDFLAEEKRELIRDEEEQGIRKSEVRREEAEELRREEQERREEDRRSSRKIGDVLPRSTLSPRSPSFQTGGLPRSSVYDTSRRSSLLDEYAPLTSRRSSSLLDGYPSAPRSSVYDRSSLLGESRSSRFLLDEDPVSMRYR